MIPQGKENLKIDLVDSSSGARIYKLDGVLTIRTLYEFQDLARRETNSVIVDLANVPYMDSAGLGSVIGLFTSCQRNNRNFGLVNIPPRILTLLQVSHVDSLLPTFASVEAAEAAFVKSKS